VLLCVISWEDNGTKRLRQNLIPRTEENLTLLSRHIEREFNPGSCDYGRELSFREEKLPLRLNIPKQ
jgi:hypothetical protein